MSVGWWIVVAVTVIGVAGMFAMAWAEDHRSEFDEDDATGPGEADD